MSIDDRTACCWHSARRRDDRLRRRSSLGCEEFYPDTFDKTAVLACRLAWNHPLLDGNKRAAWAAMVLFIDLNDGTWDPDPPDVDESEQTMLAVAAHGVDEAWLASWLRDRVRFG